MKNYTRLKDYMERAMAELKPFEYKPKDEVKEDEVEEMCGANHGKKKKKKVMEKYLGEAAKIETVDDFVSNLESTVKKIFPKSFILSKASTNLGSSISLVFALGKDRSEWVSGIIENDPLFHRFMIGWNSFAEGRFIKDKIEAELSTGGSLKINPEQGSHMAFGRAKIGWRKKTDTPDKIVDYIGNYFKKVKKVLMDNKENIPARDMELLKNKF